MLFPGYFSLHRVRFLILILHIRPFRTNFGSFFRASQFYVLVCVLSSIFFRVFFSSLFSFSKRSFSSTTFLTGLFLLPAINYLVACTTLLQCTDINVSLLNAQAHSYCYFICIGNHRKRTLLTFFFAFDFFLGFCLYFLLFCRIHSIRCRFHSESFNEIWYSAIYILRMAYNFNESVAHLAVPKKKQNKRMHCIRKPVNV